MGRIRTHLTPQRYLHTIIRDPIFITGPTTTIMSFTITILSSQGMVAGHPFRL